MRSAQGFLYTHSTILQRSANQSHEHLLSQTKCICLLFIMLVNNSNNKDTGYCKSMENYLNSGDLRASCTSFSYLPKTIHLSAKIKISV